MNVAGDNPVEHRTAKICLLRPPTLLPVDSVTSQQGVPSIGLAYLAASLKHHGHRVQVIDAVGESLDSFHRIKDTRLLINGLTLDDIAAQIDDDVDILGVSCMYSNEWLYSKYLIQELGKRFPHIPIIGGGEHFTAEPEYSFLSCPALHSIVLGEGEETIVDLVEAILGGHPLQEVAGIAYMDSGELVRTPTRVRISKVDNIPWPSWEESPLEHYLEAGLGMSSVRGRNMPMLASRGCPYKCTFCSNPTMWTQRWIPRDPQDVLAEIKSRVERYQVHHVDFYDLTAIVKRDWILEFSALLIENNMNITWSLPSGTRSEALDAEVLQAMKASGCHQLTYAPESGSPLTLKRIKKQVDLQKMLLSMRAAVKEGMILKANLIVGFPGQTKREVFASFRFMVKMAWAGVHDVAVFPFVPYPGSELTRQLVADGRIQKDAESYELFLSGNVYNQVSSMLSWSEHISNRLVKLLTVGGMAWYYSWQFLFRPWRGISTIYRLLRSRPVTMFDRVLDGLLRNFVTSRRKLNTSDVDTASTVFIPSLPSKETQPQIPLPHGP